MATRYLALNAHLASGGSFDPTANNLRYVLCDGGYTPNTAVGGDQFLTDIPAGSRLATSEPLTGVTVTGRTVNANDGTLTDPGGGDEGTLMVLYQDTGTEGTSRLINHFAVSHILDGTDDVISISADGLYEI